LGSLIITVDEEILSGNVVDKWYKLQDDSYFKLGSKEAEIRIIFTNNYKTPEYQIKKVVVLCLENRSFDHMLGYLDGVNGVKDKDIKIEGIPFNDNAQHLQIFDPGHQIENVKEQIKGNVIFHLK
jgi:phospholipase C